MSLLWDDPAHDPAWDLAAALHRCEREYELFTDGLCAHCKWHNCTVTTHWLCPEGGPRETHHLIGRRTKTGTEMTCIYCKKTDKEIRASHA